MEGRPGYGLSTADLRRANSGIVREQKEGAS